MKQPSTGLVYPLAPLPLIEIDRHCYNAAMETLYAYLAGAIDADGFITIQRSTPSATRKDGRRSTYYTAKVGLSETNPIIPTLLYETFGGWLGTHQPKNPNHRCWYVWQSTNQLAANVVNALMPFLRLKRRQAELLLEFCEQVAATPPGKPISPDQTAIREALFYDVTSLNEPRNRRVHRVAL